MNGPSLTAEVVLHSPLLSAGFGGFACERWMIPGVRPMMISVVPTAPSGRPLANAARLAAGLKAVLLRLASGPPISCGGPGPEGCRTHRQPAARCLLVLVGDGSGVNDYSGAVAAWAGNLHDRRYEVVPVCEASARVAFLGAIHSYFPWKKASVWTRQPNEAIPSVLNTAGLTTPDYRAFISYFQADGRDHADALQTALGAQGFDVFLDRTSIAAGQDIPDRIREEIAHKSVFIVLETPLVSQSSWVPAEIAIAASNRVALLAVHFPNGGRLPSLSDRRRLFVSPADLDGSGGLSDNALETICRRVSALHDFSLIRRRFQMQRALSHALLRRGLANHRLTPEGWVDVVPQWTPATVCSIRATPRVAELSDFRELDGAIAPAATWQRAVIAPGSLVAGFRQADMRWLSGVAKTALFDESEIDQVVDVLADRKATALS